MRFSRPKSRATLFFPAIAWTALLCSAAWAADPPKDLLSATRAAIGATNLTPYDVGSRYGQALGASENCPGGKMTEKASVLSSVYSGAHLEEFSVQGKRIYDAWVRAKHCVPEDNPNLCKVVIDESCATALSEIGPSGSALPGLLEISRP
ncbi:hypothetical protein [Hyphomicrobium sp.]|jgi:hypothetical protein|uniref:hypothetical protein n=1 Tax=Hyphomicrobium sp. TaxID=82 RepID=UPI0035662D79